jgi:hypothetical protein
MCHRCQSDKKLWLQAVVKTKSLKPYYGDSEDRSKWCAALAKKYGTKHKNSKKATSKVGMPSASAISNTTGVREACWPSAVITHFTSPCADKNAQ